MTSRTPPDSAARFIPPAADMEALRKAAAACTACDLYKKGTQTVFGEGPPRARLVLVGEKAGNAEDKQGRPFVGPAGMLLDRCLVSAGVVRDEAYLTNVVKHFKWEYKGKRRIHGKPTTGEIRACRPWLDAELTLLRPHALICLGATAAQALLGPAFRVSTERGRFLESPLAPYVMATVHPSSILRIPDDDARHRATDRFIDDIRKIAEVL